jgi:hypothetical protein
MNTAKADFLRHEFIPRLQKIPSDISPAWGKMTLQQMIEHFADSVAIASGKVGHTEIVTPPEHLDKLRAFLASEKPFRENTPNSLMPEIPAPVRHSSKEAALKELEEEINHFFAVFENNNLQLTRNPFFGDLTFEQNVQLLHKHALHHLKQFSPLFPNGGT